MKAIINGRRYDTTTATLIGEAGYNGSTSDFQWWEAGLYKTPRAGRYFLAGEGGPMTRWARSVGNSSLRTRSSRTSGEGIIFELEPDEALAWAEQYLKPHVVEKHFGDKR